MFRPSLLAATVLSAVALAQPRPQTPSRPSPQGPTALPSTKAPSTKLPPQPGPQTTPAQPPPAPAPAPTTPPTDTSPAQPPPTPISLDKLPPHLLLAARVESVRQRLPVIKTVVIVPDAASYIAAIGSWTLPGRFPVLIDDGSWNGQQDIARFVRAYQPESVVRWKAPAAAGTSIADGPAKKAAIENAVAKAWGAD